LNKAKFGFLRRSVVLVGRETSQAVTAALSPRSSLNHMPDKLRQGIQWPSRLVATAEENRLNNKANLWNSLGSKTARRMAVEGSLPQAKQR
jgi:hypothetical protein